MVVIVTIIIAAIIIIIITGLLAELSRGLTLGHLMASCGTQLSAPLCTTCACKTKIIVIIITVTTAINMAIGFVLFSS